MVSRNQMGKDKINFPVTESHKQKDIDQKVEELTKCLQNLTLLVERGHQRQSGCYNYQEIGHRVNDCKRECKNCNDKLGIHVFWNALTIHQNHLRIPTL